MINIFLKNDFSKSIVTLFVILNSFISFSQEICNNGIDDDNDQLIDLNDAECICNNQTTGNPTSIIPNPSFEDTNCCPTYFSEISCADTWIQATDATTDYYNTCNYIGPFGATSLIPFPDGNGAFGAIVSNGWSEYIGTCLMSPMLAGTQYTLQMQMAFTGIYADGSNICTQNFNTQTLDIFIYGHPNCGNFPLTGLTCPLNLNPNYITLSSTSLDLQATNYQTLTFTFTPTININEIIIGGPCNNPTGWPINDPNDSSLCYPYLLADNLILNTTSSFNSLSINEQGNFCTNDLMLSTSVFNDGGIYQWYQNGITILGQNNSTLNISTLGLGPGIYQVTYFIGGNCYKKEITLIPSFINELTVNNAEICEGEFAELNVSGGTTYNWTPSIGLSSDSGSNITASPNQTTVYTVSSIISNGCISETTSTVTVYNIINDINFNIIQVPSESEVIITASPANYSYTWITPEGLISNTNPLNYQSLIEEGILQFILETENEFGCLYSETLTFEISTDLIVYIPNTFTPDGNEFNNTFKPIISKNVDSETYSFFIYNRWGEVIFESKDPNIGWDGTYQGYVVQSGVYTWNIHLSNNKEKQLLNGHVNLLR